MQIYLHEKKAMGYDMQRIVTDVSSDSGLEWPQGPVLTLAKVTKSFGAITAVEKVSLQVQRGEILALLGPSGCGKTTTLRLVAGLELPDSGNVIIGDADVTARPPYQRDVGMVFQGYALFPHMSVRDNVAFGCRSRGLDKSSTQERVEKYLSLTHIAELGDRMPSQLSGGQRQRAALARALAIEPSILLLDEPLAALDRTLREEMQVEIRSLITSLSMTAMFVTHDQDEAMSLADKVAVMNLGRIEQLDRPKDVYSVPRTRFVAEFVGASTLLSGSRQSATDDVYDCGVLRVKVLITSFAEQNGDALLLIRPEHIEVVGSSNGRTDIIGEADATISAVRYLGFSLRWYGTLDDGTHVEGLTEVGPEPLRLGDRVRLRFPAEKLVPIQPDESERES